MVLCPQALMVSIQSLLLSVWVLLLLATMTPLGLYCWGKFRTKEVRPQSTGLCVPKHGDVSPQAQGYVSLGRRTGGDMRLVPLAQQQSFRDTCLLCQQQCSSTPAAFIPEQGAPRPPRQAKEAFIQGGIRERLCITHPKSGVGAGWAHHGAL